MKTTRTTKKKIWLYIPMVCLVLLCGCLLLACDSDDYSCAGEDFKNISVQINNDGKIKVEWEPTSGNSYRILADDTEYTVASSMDGKTVSATIPKSASKVLLQIRENKKWVDFKVFHLSEYTGGTFDVSRISARTEQKETKNYSVISWDQDGISYEYKWDDKKKGEAKDNSITISLEENKTHTLRVRRKTSLSVEEGRANDILIRYQDWSAEVAVCRVPNITSFYFDNRYDAIFVPKVTDGYEVSAYYTDAEHPFYNDVGRVESVADMSQTVSIPFDTKGIDKSFTLRIQPRGVNKVVDNKLLIGDVAEKTITYCLPISQIGIEGGAFVWGDVEGCEYQIVRQYIGSDIKNDKDVQKSYTKKNGKVYFSDLMVDSQVILQVKPIYKSLNTFSHWTESEPTYVYGAPDVTTQRNGNNILLTWKNNGSNYSQYSIRILHEGTTVVSNSKVSVSSLSYLLKDSDLNQSGTYTVEIACTDLNSIGLVTSFEIERLPTPELNYSHVEATDTKRDCVAITIENVNRRYGYSYISNAGSGELSFVWDSGQLLVYNTSECIEGKNYTVEIYACAKDGSNVQLDSKTATVTVSKRKSVINGNISVDNSGLRWKGESGSTYAYSLVNQNVGKKWDGNLAQEELSFSTVPEVLPGGNYVFSLKNRSTQNNILDSELTQYYFGKAYTPTDAICDNYLLNWQYPGTATVGNAGYRISLDDVPFLNGVYENNTVNLQLYSDKIFADAKNVIAIVAVGTNLGKPILDSEPLLYTKVGKRSVPQNLTVKNSILSCEENEQTTVYTLKATAPNHSEKTETFAGIYYNLVNQQNFITMAGQWILQLQAKGDGVSVFDSDWSGGINITKLSQPVLTFNNQTVLISYKESIGSSPARLRCTVNGNEYSLVGGQTKFVPDEEKTWADGTYSVIVTAIGDGVNTLTATASETLTLKKQAAPVLTFGANGYISMSFAPNNSGSYKYCIDEGTMTQLQVSASDYAIESATLSSGAHYFYAYLCGDDGNNLLASSVSSCRFIKLSAPEVVLSSDYRAVWSVRDYNYLSYYKKYTLSLTVGQNTSSVDLNTTSYSDFSALTDGTSGLIKVRAVGSVSDKTLSSEWSAPLTVRRATSPTLSFDNQTVRWTPESGRQYRVFVGEQSQSVTSDGTVALNFVTTQATISVRTEGSSADGLLPALQKSNEITVKRLSKPTINTDNIQDGTIAWSCVEGVRYAYTLKNTDTDEGISYSSDTDKTSVLITDNTTKKYTLSVKVLAKNLSGSNYLDSAETVYTVVKVAKPNAQLYGTDLVILPDSGISYRYRVDNGDWMNASTRESLASYHGTHTVDIQACKEGCIASEIVQFQFGN